MVNPDRTECQTGMTQVAATLCSIMGMDCLKVMYSLPTLTEGQRKDPKAIIKKLREHFIPQKHVLFERYKFNTVSQQISETIDEFVVRLRQLAAPCEFGDLTESLINDRLVIGTTDITSRDRLLRERPVPDLNRCVESLRASELSRSHQQQFEKAKGSSVEYVRGKKNSTGSGNRPRDGRSKTQTPKKNTQPHSDKGKKCQWCGRTPHARKHCPAKDALCRKCGRKGHFQLVCRDGAKKVDEIEGSEEDVISFLGEIGRHNYWSATVNVDGEPCQFKLDSGAEVSIISDTNLILKKIRLTPTSKKLGGPGGTQLNVLGSCYCSLKVGNKEYQETLYVLKNQTACLLSKKACEALKLLTPASEVYEVKSPPDFKKEFPEMFKGLGNLKTQKYKITLRPDAKPVSLNTARKVAHALQPKVKQELDVMLREKVISPVRQPTDWCSGMVPVPKANGRIRICVDLTRLNSEVLREVHPMRTVEDNLAKLAGSSVYTKLDANSGFWQIPLDEESQIPNYLHYPTWAVLFQPSSIRYQLRPGGFPENYVGNSRRPGGSWGYMSHGRYTHSWKK